MDIELTIHAHGQATDLRVRATGPHSAKELRESLAHALGQPVGHLSAAGLPVADSCIVGEPPLVHGASLVVESAPTHRPISAVSLWTLDVTSGPDAGRSMPLTSPVQFGRASSCRLSIADPSLSREHATVSVSAERIRVEDHDSTNGVDVGQGPSGGQQDLVAGQAIRAGGSTLTVRRTEVGSLPATPTGEGHLVVQPAPQHTPRTSPITLERPVAPVHETRSGMPWIPALIPLPLAGVMAIFLGPQLLWFAVMSPLMMLGSAVNDRWGRRRREREATARHTQACADYEGRLADGLAAEASVWAGLAPDPVWVLDRATRRAPGLWSRVRGDHAWGAVRVGWGDPASELVLIGKPGSPTAERPRHSRAPVVLNLLKGSFTSVVGAQDDVIPLLRNVLGQLAVHHSAEHLTITVVSDAEWEWTRLLPHTAGAPTPTRQAIELINRLRTPSSDHLLVIPDASRVRALPDLVTACQDADIALLVGSSEALAVTPDAVLDISFGAGSLQVFPTGITGHRAPTPQKMTVSPDGVGWWWAERVARALAPLRTAGMPPTTGQPATLRELIGDTPHSDAAAAATVGLANGHPWSIDLDADGPHMLVGGTTGSGKSEFLRALVMSLALRSAPSALAFVLVDYKGGASFGGCTSLPHVAGVLTDLDAGHAQRALTSLQAEIARRERLLAQHHVTDRAGYLSAIADDEAAKALMPRLVIVIDEFRALAVEQPDVLAGIVHAAAIGRSLGVHLILATQRPSGVISAEIQANVNLRIALRMRDKHDSIDVIDSPDAAALSPDRPGCGLARGGDGELVSFQALPVSVHTPRPEAGLRVTALGERAPTPDGASDALDDLEVLAHRLRDVAQRDHLPLPPPVWLPPLPETLTAEDATACLASSGCDVTSTPGVVGMIDQPARQRYAALTWTQASGHWLVVGAPRSGRTTAARSVIAAALRDAGAQQRPVHIHVIDAGGDWAAHAVAPGLGTVTGPHEPRRLARFLDRLDAEIERRQAERSSLANDPRLLVVVDGLDRLDGTDRFAAKPLTDRVLRLLAVGPKVGLTLALTGDRSLLNSPGADHAQEFLILPLADPTDLALIGLRRADAPTAWLPGRAVRASSAAEAVQLIDTSWDLRAPFSSVKAAGEQPWVVQDLPQLVRAAELPASTQAELVLGVVGDPIELEVWRPEQDGRVVTLVGGPRSGRSTAIAAFASAACTTYPVVVVSSRRSEPMERLRAGGVRVIDPSEKDVLVALRSAHPNLVVCVDDAERILDAPIEPVLLEILDLVERDAGLVVAALDPTVIAAHYRGFALQVTRARRGYVLSPTTARDGDCIGATTLPVIDRLPGRAFRVGGSEVQEVQFVSGPSSEPDITPSADERPVGVR